MPKTLAELRQQIDAVDADDFNVVGIGMQFFFKAVILDVLILAHKDETMLNGRLEVLHDNLDHGFAMHGDEGLRVCVSRICKAASTSCHGYDDIKHVVFPWTLAGRIL